MRKSFDFFRCMRCSKLFERADFCAGISHCSGCGGGQFSKARAIYVFEFVLYLLTHPRLILPVIRGAEINV